MIRQLRRIAPDRVVYPDERLCAQRNRSDALRRSRDARPDPVAAGSHGGPLSRSVSDGRVGDDNKYTTSVVGALAAGWGADRVAAASRAVLHAGNADAGSSRGASSGWASR